MKATLTLAAAQTAAKSLQHLLGPTCQVWQVAGSVRREKPHVGDLEFVVVPAYESRQKDLFDTAPYNLLVDAVAAAAARREIYPALGTNGKPRAWETDGFKDPRYLALVFNGVPVELWVVPQARRNQWGYIYWLRTGPSEANKLMMQEARWGGLRPAGVALDDGTLYKKGPDGMRVYDAPTEAEVFDFFQMAYVSPALRSPEAYRVARAMWLEKKNDLTP